jgi:predicted phage tail protein
MRTTLHRALGLPVLFALAFVGSLRAVDLDISLNEMLFHPPAGLDGAEFVELYNRGAAPVDLSGWKFTHGISFTFPASTAIPAGGFLVVCRNRTLAASLFPGARLAGNYTGTLPRSGGRIRLETAGGIVVENFAYGTAEGWPVEARGRGASLERRSPEGTPHFADSWASSLTLLGSPGRVNTRFREIVEKSYIAAGDTWNYWKGTAEPSAPLGAWAAASFDDSAWLSGPTGIGYGDLDDATVLDDMLGAYSTVYLRKTFQVPDPASVLSLIFTVDYDDGFVAYLNGVEVTRRGAPGDPGTPLAFDALASLSHEAGTPETIDLSNDRSLLQSGENTFAIQVLNYPIDSSDLSMEPALSGFEEIIGVDLSLNRLVQVTAVARGDSWKYFKGTAEPADPLGAWVPIEFDDSGWPEAPTGFGYGTTQPPATLLSDMMNGYRQLYVRKHFTVTDPALVAGMTFGNDYDDGFVAYLNGAEIARNAAPGTAGTPVAFNLDATVSHGYGSEESFDISAFASALVAGDNVLAVQGINRAISNGDFFLAPTLKTLQAVPGDPRALVAGIAINEVYAPGGGAGWVELHNGLDEEVDASGYGLTDDAGLPVKFALPADTRIAGKGFLAIDEAALGFSLASAGSLFLTDAAGVVLIDGLIYSIPAGSGYSAGCLPDGDPGELSVLTAPTREASNEAPADRGVAIDEIGFHPLAAPGAAEVEWVELQNLLADPVSLEGWTLAGAVEFDFPAGASIPGSGFVVVASDPAAVEAKHGITGVLGPWTGELPNGGARIELRDDLGNLADEVRYAAGGLWPAGADGTGPSAELVNPGLDNSIGLAWAASAGEGTPAAANSAFDAQPQPIVSAVRHAPAVPRSTDAVTVSARIEGVSEIVAAVLYYRDDGAPAFEEMEMLDDGAHGDGAAGDGVFACALPARPAGTVVEFFFQAEDGNGKIRAYPPAAPADNLLYQVDDATASADLPAYRLVMTAARLSELESRDVSSDALLPATFISGSAAIHGTGVRYTGSSRVRLASPKGYRVEFPPDFPFDGERRIDLLGLRPWSALVALDAFGHADVPAPVCRPVHLVVDAGAPASYLMVEAVDEAFLGRAFDDPAGEDRGNLYRGEATADLAYRGTDEESYRGSYRKLTNAEEDDYSDIIDLCDRITNTPEGGLASAVGAVADLREWARFFAVHSAINTATNCIWRDAGDDYGIYRRPSDGRFVLIPGELDDAFRNPTEPIVRPTLEMVRKVLTSPDVSPYFFDALLDVQASILLPARLDGLIGLLEDTFPPDELAAMVTYASGRATYVESQVPQDLTAHVESLSIVRAGDSWRYFRGLSEPTEGTIAWTALGFDDSAWETGPGGIGFGDNDDATVLADMLGAYSTVYLRQAFTVDDPSDLTALELSVDYDDGFVAYLNGIEVARANAGAAGSIPTFDALATADHEAGVPQSFSIPNASSILVAGENVLAIQVLNVTLASTDLSIIPNLRTSGVVAEGCTGDTFVTGEMAILAGQASVAETRRVLVNGVDAAYDNLSGLWAKEIPLARGIQTLTVQAIGLSGATIATSTVKIYAVRTVGGSITGDVTWRAADSPFLVVGSVTIADNAKLTIEPGSTFYISPGAGFNVVGQIQVLGTESARIDFGPMPCKGDWAGFNMASTPDDNIFRYSTIHNVTALAGIHGGGSTLIIEGVHIHHITGEGINIYGCKVRVTNSMVEQANEAFSIDGCQSPVVEFNENRSLIGKSDLCDMNGSNPPARVAFNIFHNNSDDGLDFDDGNEYCEGNIIYNTGDQAASLVGPGSTTLYRNIFYRCNIGVSSKDSHRTTVDHCTIASNTSIGLRAILKTAGRGYGTIDIKNSIVWGSPVSLLTDEGGTITASYCDLGGTQTEGNVTLGDGIIAVNPKFVNAAANDYRLMSDSPCIGAAEDGSDLGAIQYETIPKAPSNLRVAGTTPVSISLAWNDNSWAETSYEIWRQTSVDFTPQYLVLKGDPVRFFRGRSEPSGGTLDWTGVSFDDAAWESGATGLGYGDGDDATVLSDMQNSYTTVYLRRAFTVSDPSGITTLEFMVDFDDGFIAFLNGTEIARVNAGTAGTYPAYNATASGDREAGTALIFPVTVTGILTAGTNVLAIQVLNLTSSSSDLSMIPELRTVDEGPYDLIVTLLPDHLACVDETANRLAKNSYKVRAVNALGESAFSNAVSVEGGNLPAAPADLRVTSFGPSAIGLAWSDLASDETSYELWRADGFEDFELITSLPSGTTSHEDLGLTQYTSYRYRVRARNGYGPSDWSNEVAQVADDPPAAPSNLVVTGVTLTTIGLAFQDNSDDETGFELEMKFVGGNFNLKVTLGADVAAYNDVDLESGKTYTYRVRAVNAAGASPYSDEVTGTTATLPIAPADLTVGGVGLSTIALSWVDAASNETGYEVERKASGDPDFALVASLAADSRDLSDGGLLPGTTYTYRVRAVNEFGPSAYSNEVSGTTGTLPEEPGSLAVTAIGLGALSLAWIDLATDETGYVLERRPAGGTFETAAELPPGTVDYFDGSLARGATYTYRVRALNIYGPSDWSNEVEATTGKLPAVPLDLAVTSFSASSVSLAWTDVADDEDGFEIERRQGYEPFVLAGRISPDGTAFIDSGLLPGTLYAYRVRSVNVYGASDWSAEVEVTTGRPPAAPADLSIDATTLNALILSWSDLSDNEATFEVERRSAGGGIFERIASTIPETTTFVDADLEPRGFAYRVRAVNEYGISEYTNEVSAVPAHLPADPTGIAVLRHSVDSLRILWEDNADNETAYEVERRSESGLFAMVASLPPGTQETIDSGLPQSTMFTYRVRAVNAYGSSAYTLETGDTTPHVPATPEGLAAVMISDDSLQLSWTDRADNETGYQVERRGPGEADFRLIVLLPPDAEAYLDVGLVRGSTYRYRVRAVGEFADSAYSEEAVGVTGQAPAAPQDLVLTGFSSGRILIGWTDMTGGSSGAEIERGPDGGAFALIASVPPGVSRFTDTTAQDGIAYRYRVRSVNAFGTSIYSNEVLAATQVVISSIEPATARTAGGESVTIAGLNFSPDTVVLLGGAALVDAQVSFYEIRGKAPAHDGGVVDVRAENALGFALNRGAFTYVAPLLRGDCSISGKIDIADPIYLLGALYLGGSPLLCDALANVNGDPYTDLSDAVYTLTFLFMGGPPPTPETVECP